MQSLPQAPRRLAVGLLVFACGILWIGPATVRADPEDERRDLRQELTGSFLVITPTATGGCVATRTDTIREPEHATTLGQPMSLGQLVRGLMPTFNPPLVVQPPGGGPPQRAEQPDLPAIVFVIPPECDLGGTIRLIDTVVAAFGTKPPRYIVAVKRPRGGWLLARLAIVDGPGRRDSIVQDDPAPDADPLLHLDADAVGPAMQVAGCTKRRLPEQTWRRWLGKLELVRRELEPELGDARHLIGEVGPDVATGAVLRDLLQLALLVNRTRRPDARVHLRWSGFEDNPPGDRRVSLRGLTASSGGSRTGNLKPALFTGQPISDNLPSIQLTLSQSAGPRLLEGAHERRAELLEKLPSRGSVALALRWLREHQNEDGSWSPDDFSLRGRAAGRTGDYANRDAVICRGRDELPMRVAITAMAAMAFLAAGHSMEPEDEGAYVLEGALGWLAEQSNEDGALGFDAQRPQWSTYAHALATWAFLDAYYALGHEWLINCAKTGVQRIARTQVNVTGDRSGWRYSATSGGSDSSVTGLMAIVLAIAQRCGLELPEKVAHGFFAHYDSVVRGDDRDVVVYRPGTTTTSPLYARELVAACRLMQHEDPRLTRLARTWRNRLADSAFRQRPEVPRPLDGAADLWGWHFGALAAALVSGDVRETWATSTRAAVTSLQRLDVDVDHAVYGSWDSTSEHCRPAGRVFSTALNCVTLLTPIRYPDWDR